MLILRQLTRRTVKVVVCARVPAWPPCETSVNVTFWPGVAPVNLFAVPTAFYFAPSGCGSKRLKLHWPLNVKAYIGGSWGAFCLSIRVIANLFAKGVIGPDATTYPASTISFMSLRLSVAG